jgi:multisubunit Na+/H+ antiporter MnhF subunit
MADILTAVLHFALVVHVLLIAVCVWRVWRGENVIDRLIAADLVAMLILAVLVLVSLIRGQPAYLDVALGLAALGFISAIAFAKHLADDRMF